MRIKPLHRWDLAPKEAVECQRDLAQRIQRHEPFPLRDGVLVAGADISYNRFSPWMHAAVVVLRFPDGDVVEQTAVTERVAFPYVPGLLSFREAPPILAAWGQLRHRPDLLMVDGQGYAHPRRFGLACHLGLWLDLATVGCAKSLLIGYHAPLPVRVGSQAPLLDDRAEQETIGMAVRTRQKVKPIYVSVGHRIDLASAVAWTLALSRGYRQPEPTRLAHHAANARRRDHEPG